MNPNTNAELIAYNLGAEAARVDELFIPGELPAHTDQRIALTPERAQARDVLGPELFWSWADRGYGANRRVGA